MAVRKQEIDDRNSMFEEGWGRPWTGAVIISTYPWHMMITPSDLNVLQ